MFFNTIFFYKKRTFTRVFEAMFWTMLKPFFLKKKGIAQTSFENALFKRFLPRVLKNEFLKRDAPRIKNTWPRCKKNNGLRRKNDQCRRSVHLYDLLDVLDLIDELHPMSSTWCAGTTWSTWPHSRDRSRTSFGHGHGHDHDHVPPFERVHCEQACIQSSPPPSHFQ